MTTAPGGIVVLLTSPRLPAGVLTREAWEAVGSAAAVLTADAEDPQAEAVAATGTAVTEVEDAAPAAVAALLVERAAATGGVVWIGSADGDPGLTDALAAALTGLAEPPPVEMLVGSWDPPGARLLDAVETMDRLRSPGGCPWDAEQTHASLLPYLLEEAHELVEAAEAPGAAEGDPTARAHLAEELGDVLLQVLFHARVAAEHERVPFDIDDVAGGLVAKLVHRHPHVFAVDPDEPGGVDAAAVEANWERLKASEKPQRSHPLDGIPPSLPDLARTVKVVTRLERAGLVPQVDAWLATRPEADTPGEVAARRILDAVRSARADGVDPVAALRGLLRDLHAHLAEATPPTE